MQNSQNNSQSPASNASGPVFVVGLWRSGTSLLYTLLNQHPGIALMYEADLPLLSPLFRSGGSNPDWLERWEFWNSALSRHRINIDTDSRQIPEIVADLPTGAEFVWKQYAGDALYGEKSPNYYDSLRWLSQQFPNARFVVIWRDPADICRSILRAAQSGSPFFSKRGIILRALIGTRRMKTECEALARRGVPLHQIQYEEMINDPEQVLSGICNFLQIPFHPPMASLDGADRSAIYEADHHAGVKSKIIGPKKAREEIVPLPFKNKIDRYVAYWQQEYNGEWPAYPKSSQGNLPQPGVMERAWDEVHFRSLRAFDRFTSLVYCYAPISLLRLYRSAKAKPAASKITKSQVQKESAALPEVSPRG